MPLPHPLNPLFWFRFGHSMISLMILAQAYRKVWRTEKRTPDDYLYLETPAPMPLPQCPFTNVLGTVPLPHCPWPVPLPKCPYPSPLAPSQCHCPHALAPMPMPQCPCPNDLAPMPFPNALAPMPLHSCILSLIWDIF